MSKRALLLGASGETGKEVLKELVGSPTVSKVVCVGRRQLELGDSPKIEQRVVDFDNLDAHKTAFGDVDMAFCCLGTTRGKAGKEGFIKVDHDYVVGSAKLLAEAGCPDFHLLTSKGSNANSWFLYPKVKGQVEDELKALGFTRCSIYRPGLLICERNESRPGERLAQCMAGFMDRSSSMSVTTAALAKAMVRNSLRPVEGASEVLEHAKIVNLGKD